MACLRAWVIKERAKLLLRYQEYSIFSLQSSHRIGVRLLGQHLQRITDANFSLRAGDKIDSKEYPLVVLTIGA